MRKNNRLRVKDPIETILRDVAEVNLLRSYNPSSEINESTTRELLHELQVHQIELEMQNEELRKSQIALDESRQRFADLYDFAPVGYFTFTREALIKEVNLTGATLLGEARKKLINSRFRKTVTADDQDRWDRHFLSVLQEGEKQTCDLILKQRDGSPFSAGLESIRIEGNGGTPEVHTIVTDITARKQAEGDLRKSQEKYLSIFENSLEGIYQATPEGRFLTVNPALARMYGYDSAEELLNSVTDIAGQIYVNPEQRREYLRLLEERGEIKGLEVQLKRKDGTPFWVSNSGRAVRDSMGKTLYYEGITEEITQRLESERKIKETLENLRKALTGIIQVIAATVETRDPYTSGHQRRTASLARAIAGEMGLADNQQEGVLMAGIIHDLGKVSVPAEILSKPTKLTEIEYDLIKVHSQVGYNILKDIDFPWPIAEIVLQHHERMNGSGYPQGLKGEAISPEAQILMVADVVEAMASYRPYRPALGIDPALEEIEKNKGILYDSQVVEICLGLFREKGFSFE